MSSAVFICNLALSNIGKGNIVSLSEDSAEARACNQFYEHVRDLLLQAYPWRFAGKTASLAEIDNDKPGAWEYAYTRPTDCLKVRSIRPQYLDDEVVDPNTVVPSPYGYLYEIEGSTIYTDLSPAFLRYTYRITDPTKFKPLFIEAFSWHLSVRLAMPLTRDSKVRAEAYKLATATQAGAEMADANEERETSNIESDFIVGRA